MWGSIAYNHAMNMEQSLKNSFSNTFMEMLLIDEKLHVCKVYNLITFEVYVSIKISP